MRIWRSYDGVSTLGWLCAVAFGERTCPYAERPVQFRHLRLAPPRLPHLVPQIADPGGTDLAYHSRF